MSKHIDLLKLGENFDEIRQTSYPKSVIYHFNLNRFKQKDFRLKFEPKLTRKTNNSRNKNKKINVSTC